MRQWFTTGPIHTGHEHANLRAFPLMLLASNVNTPICNSRFHLLAFAPAHPVWITSKGNELAIYCVPLGGERRYLWDVEERLLLRFPRERWVPCQHDVSQYPDTPANTFAIKHLFLKWKDECPTGRGWSWGFFSLLKWTNFQNPFFQGTWWQDEQNFFCLSQSITGKWHIFGPLIFLWLQNVAAVALHED